MFSKHCRALYILALCIFWGVEYCAFAAASSIDVYRYNLELKFAWMPGTDNPPFYNIRIRENDTVTQVTTQNAPQPTLPQCTFAAKDGFAYEISVRPADGFGETGPWSPASDKYVIHKLSAPPQVSLLFEVDIWSLGWLSEGGVIKAYLGNLPSPYVASDIVASTIRLNGIEATAPSTVLESGYSGFSTDPVLQLRLRKSDLVASLGTSILGIYPVVITGNFHDNESFEAHATITLIGTLAAPTAPLPQAFSVGPNYPNAFNPDTWVPYALPEDAYVTIDIYNAYGTNIRHLDIGHRRAGHYTTQKTAAYWNGTNELGERMPSGVYFFTFRTNAYTATGKMVMLK